MDQESKKTPSWLWKWVANNKLVSVLVIVLLVLLNLLLLSQLSYLFLPVQEVMDIAGFPLITAGIFYYMMKPIKDYFVSKNIRNTYAVLLVFVVLLLIMIAIVITIVPILKQQLTDLLSQLPYYYDEINKQLVHFTQSTEFEGLRQRLYTLNSSIVSSFSEKATSVLNATVSGFGGAVGKLGEVLVGLILIPIILYYLLMDGGHIIPAIAKVFPTKSRTKIEEVLHEMNGQVSQYIRGQVIVAIAVAIMFMVGYSLIGLPFAMSIAILSGILNIIPFVGSFIGTGLAIVVGAVHSPLMLVKVIIVFLIEQTIEGNIISPLVLGNNLKIHPATVLMVLLVSGKLFGVIGLLVGVPAFAVAKVIATHAFKWYKRHHTDLYQEDESN